MQLDFLVPWIRRRSATPQSLPVGPNEVPIQFLRNPRARRYVLRVRRDGSARVTIPRGGSIAFAVEFARKNSGWIEQQISKRRLETQPPPAWGEGTEVLFRGERVPIRLEASGSVQVVRLGEHALTTGAGVADLRLAVENYLWNLAAKELPVRTMQLAAQQGLTVGKVMVRSQRSRWGSCSVRGTISLNWRLIQAPLFVRDYLILHELMHLREMNHSARFWRAVAAACPDYQLAEKWLDAHSALLRRGGRGGTDP